MLEFKLQYYFEKYKDISVVSSSKFKTEFIKKEGNFDLLNELIVMIQRYQYKKYGEAIPYGTASPEILGNGVRAGMEQRRIRQRFGTKEDRLRRKLEELRK